MQALPSNYQAATLVASPSYPNSIAWSNENLVAIPSEHLITILNPASLSSARAVITLRQSKPFPIGLVDRNDLLTPCLQPICLSKDSRPCARSISWSPLGLAPNSGCFLAVCTADGRVKLYRAPYCEYSSEWIEAADISDLLFDHINSINYGELNGQPSGIHGSKSSNSMPSRSKKGLSDSNFSNISTCRKRKGADMHADFIGESTQQKSNPDIINDGGGEHGMTMEDNEANLENCVNNSINHSTLPRITAQQFASRSAALFSLVVSWSPLLQSTENCCAILSIGTKSGAVSFWKICEPQYFTINHGNIPVNPMLVGLFQAHNSWITSICFGISSAGSLKSQLVLATGCSDGSVKIWSANVEGFISAKEVKCDCFLLLAEVTTSSSSPVSTMGLVIPAKSPEHVVLAVGRGAGKLEVGVYDLLSKNLRFVADYNAHEQVVTGLAWAFDGSCLYSCSQDNSIRSWIFNGDTLNEAPLSSIFPTSDASNNLSRVSDLCLGLALSPGEIILAVVRSFDSNLQNQMYEKRSQRAVVEFFRSGGHSFDVKNDMTLKLCRFKAISHSSEPELACLETNILRLLKRFENANKPLVIWDIISLLRVLRLDFPGLVEIILTKWISGWCSDSSSDSPKKMLFHDRDKISTVSSRKLQLLNVICRRVMLREIDNNLDKENALKFSGLNGMEGNHGSWNELLAQSERELRERLVAFSFQVILNRSSNCQVSVGEGANWSPVGVAQMEQWTVVNDPMIDSRLKLLRSKIAKLRGRNKTDMSKHVEEEENCSFCSSPVTFDSPEMGWCDGITRKKGSNGRHRLTRCMVSMCLCPVTEPLWFCICCQRLAAELLPRTFFTAEISPLDLRCESGFPNMGEMVKPLCPFCGILLQRSVPDFLLSTSPV